VSLVVSQTNFGVFDAAVAAAGAVAVLAGVAVVAGSALGTDE
jgi:hypothetical protein